MATRRHAKTVTPAYLVANPRGIPHEDAEGNRIAILTLRAADGTAKREWHEGDAIAEADLSAIAWQTFRANGFIVTAEAPAEA